MPAVILRSSCYVSNLFASAEAVRHAGKLFAPADGARITMIDPRDVAARGRSVEFARDYARLFGS